LVFLTVVFLGAQQVISYNGQYDLINVNESHWFLI